MEQQLSLEQVREMSDAPTIILLFITLIFVAVYASCFEDNYKKN